MAEVGDIVLGGTAYKLVPGKYAQTSEGVSDAERRGRHAVRDFSRGLGFPVDGGKGGGWDGLTVGPVGRGRGVEPWPGDAVQTDTSILTVPSSTVMPVSAISGSYVYMAIGQYVYRSAATSAASWSAWTQVANAGTGNVVAGMMQYGDDLLLMLGGGADILKFNTGTSTTSTWRTGERAAVGVGYAGIPIYANGIAGTREQLRFGLTKYNGNSVTDTVWLDAPLVAAGVFQGKAVFATKRSLWLVYGDWYEGDAGGGKCEWLGTAVPVFSHGLWVRDGDFPFLLAFAGKMWTWVGGRVVTWDGDLQGGSWTAEVLQGQSCTGATVAGGWLVVAIVARSGSRELWATDGVSGWWLLQRASSASSLRLSPTAVGGCGGRDVAVFRSGSQTYDLLRLDWRSTTAHTYPSAGTGTYTSGLLDAGEQEAVKVWRRAGAVLDWPDVRGNSASTDAVTVTLEATVDGGSTWATVGTASASAGGTRVVEIEGAMPAGTVWRSRVLQLRVSWSSVLDWAPVLTGLWADWSGGSTGAVRRRWELEVDARDGAVLRDGSKGGTGQSVADALWAAYTTGSVLTYRDVDYDQGTAQVSVLVAGIKETVGKPSDAGRFGARGVALTLVEV